MRSRQNGLKSTDDSQDEILAIRALGFLASDSDRFERFLSLSGMTAEAVRNAATSKQVLKGVLEHILADESLLLVFCSEINAPPEDIYPVARRLDGGIE